MRLVLRSWRMQPASCCRDSARVVLKRRGGSVGGVVFVCKRPKGGEGVVVGWTTASLSVLVQYLVGGIPVFYYIHLVETGLLLPAV